MATKLEKGYYAVYNPHGKPFNELPVIYGFNHGGYPGSFMGVLLAEDGTSLGAHLCSHEGHMKRDLGISEGTRPDRHEEFKKHYPNGYRMDFVSREDTLAHKGLKEALKKNQNKKNKQ